MILVSISARRFRDKGRFHGRATMTLQAEQGIGQFVVRQNRTQSERTMLIHSFPRLALYLAFMLSLSATSGSAQTGGLSWRTFVVPEYGTRVDYPSGMFVPTGAPKKGVGKEFERADGRAVLSIYSLDNQAGDTPGTYVRKNLRTGKRALDYERIARSFFAISMERDGKIFYSRCNFSRARRGAIHCFDLVYPQDEKRAWDPVVTRISLSLRPLEG